MPIQTIIQGPDGSGLSCAVFQGHINRLRLAGEVYHRLGRTGAGTQSIGYRAEPSQCRAMAPVATLAAAQAARAAILKLSLEPRVTVTDDFGESIPCCLHNVTARIMVGKFGWNGVSYPYCVIADLLLEHVGDTPSQASTDQTGFP